MSPIDELQRINETGKMTINGREYAFTAMRHKERRKVFAFFTSIRGQLEENSFAFMDEPKFDEIMGVIENLVTFDGSLLSRLGTHWDLYSQDFIEFVVTAMGVMSYPFLVGSRTGSQSAGVPREKI
jgi:hypothetical protein